ncbi:putative modified peptide [Kribbella antibiotica]|uniref:Putative modified peptide n=1 Tax=Kribbella antibiotica TaxID=190195 RepID=A0A4R4YQ76_9ACTN|nr:NHLP-related RiPP peptide [Kribbella antibiotica]TDD47273.1 putative modified peptide [Kribbella antibiotica]
MTPTIQGTKLQFPPAVVDRLLDLLATNDTFRELFAENRHAALVRAGFELSEVELRERSPFSCLIVDRLASKESIAESRDQLRAHLLGAGTHTVVFFLGTDSQYTTRRRN